MECGGGEKERLHGGGVDEKREGRVDGAYGSSGLVRGLFLGPLLVGLT